MEKAFFSERYAAIGGRILESELKQSIRVNTTKIKTEELIRRLEKKGVSFERIPFVSYGFFYRSRFSLGSTSEYLMGYYYLHEAASMLPVIVLDPKEDELVLDMCAAPGSKTTQLSQLMNNNGIIIAVDKNKERIAALMNNLERLGCSNVFVFNEDALKFSPHLKFDKILLDAPCSGNYATDRSWFAKRDLPGIKNNSETQKKLIEKAFSLLKENGALVYSTCSLEPEEDEEVVDFALKNFSFHLEETGLSTGSPGVTSFEGKDFDNSLKLSRRLWPFKAKTQGFFIAKLRRFA
ncbi:MAG: NOL1/NOP2/sun family putative RNA methylase [Candidatus Woesearchaeota archaeon]|nr:NOL1/NOP2/sun family putative RNA methylase [Candidatus Woesearchaeota archaeon]